jgi:hypothetical protein
MFEREADLSSLVPSHKTRAADDEAPHWIYSTMQQILIHGILELASSPCRSQEKRVDSDHKGTKLPLSQRLSKTAIEPLGCMVKRAVVKLNSSVDFDRGAKRRQRNLSIGCPGV